ncbi:MAG: hypothetical protein ACC618_02915 [Patescibacteria group bacterium]
MTAESERVISEGGPHDEKEKRDRFIDHFDLNTRMKILGLAAGFSGDLETLLFMLDKEKGREKPLTRDELLSFLPEKPKQK